MCDQTPIEYKNGDIVWVKLGSYWWPGEVNDLEKLPQEWLSEFKKRPIAAVKFFDEDTYEYVKSIDKIYSYNCTKKNDFIRRGLDLYRAKNTFMDKFPSDVITAEKKTDGNPDIINDPMFAPEKRPDYNALFGTSPKAKKPRKSTRGRRSSTSKISSPASSSRASNKTATPRSLGQDDHDIRVLLQSPSKSEIAPTGKSFTTDSNYNCTSCGFSTTRIDVIILHNKSHIQGVYSTPTMTLKKGKKATTVVKAKKPLKMTRSKTSTLVEDLALLEKGIPLNAESSEEDVEDEWDEPKPKRKRKKSRGKPKKIAKKVAPKKKEKEKEDIRDNLLAEWEDDESEEENSTLNTSAEIEPSCSKSSQSKQSDTNDSKEDGDTNKSEDDCKKEDKSCFDFNDEDDSEIIEASSNGRKIPRVIPSSETKPKSADEDEKEEKEEEEVEDLHVTADSIVETEQEQKIEPEKDAKKETNETKLPEVDDEAFKNILHATAVPDLPEIPGSLKFEQNFHDDKTVKFPDKSETASTAEDKPDKPETKEATEASAKLINPKKRFVKSFEDFEQQLNNEQKKLSEAESAPDKLKSLVEVSKLKTQLMSKLEGGDKLSLKESHKAKRSDDENALRAQARTTRSGASRSSLSDSLPLKKDESDSRNVNDVGGKSVMSSSKRRGSQNEDANAEARVTRSRISPMKSPKSPKVPEVKETVKKPEQSEDKQKIQSTKTQEVTTEAQDGNTDSLVGKEVTCNEKREDTDSAGVKEVTCNENDLNHQNDNLKNDEKVPSEVGLNKENKLEVNKSVQEYVESNMTQNSEDLSALTTLATVSELTTNFDIQSVNEKTKIIEENLIVDKSKVHEGLTFVTEDDLADGQVEIADSTDAKHKTKPVTLTNFSVDFTDTNNGANSSPTSADELKPLVALPYRSPEARTNKRKRSQDEEDKSGKIFVHEDKQKESKNDLVANSKFDLEDQIPSLAVYTAAHDQKAKSHEQADSEYSSPKLLEILTDQKAKPLDKHGATDTASQSSKKIEFKPAKETAYPKVAPKFDPKSSKFIIKSTIPTKPNVNVTAVNAKQNKPVILSEKLIKPIAAETDTVQVQKVSSKKNQDIEDIDKFIIRKTTKKIVLSSEAEREAPVVTQPLIRKPIIAPRGKAKILQQTIIKPAGEIHTTSVASTSVPQASVDDGMFDINSMPIVLGDQILTAENIENMPVVLSDSVQSTTTTYPVTTSANASLSTKTVTTAPTAVPKTQSEQIKLLNKSPATTQSMLVKTYAQKLGKNQRIYQTTGTKLIKTNPAIITRPGKPDKFIIVPTTSTPTGSKYTVGKRTPIVKKSPVVIPSTKLPATPVQTAEPTGNKIMIVTNQQGQQSRVLLTPAQQKLLGYQTGGGSKLVKSTLKGNILQKTTTPKAAPSTATAKISSHVINSKGELVVGSNQSLITSDGQVLMPVRSQQIKNLKMETPKSNRKIQMHSQVVLQEGNTQRTGQQKTIVIKNQQGQIVKRLQGTDDALLDQQVAEQVQAIKASGSFVSMRTKQESYKPKPQPVKRTITKRTSPMEAAAAAAAAQRNIARTQMLTTSIHKTETTAVPPLAPISPKKPDLQANKKDEAKPEAKSDQTQQKPLNQLIIQDAQGNQTTITEGQILALPSETIDGQPQSYMLVTLDESGNLAPLNNEALLSLDPNLCLGGDLSNMVLQIDDGAASLKQDAGQTVKPVEASTNTVKSDAPKEKKQPEVVVPVSQEQPKVEDIACASATVPATTTADTVQQNLEGVQTVTCSIGNDPNQQLIITGDPITTQKFIESLTEGNPDLANLLASAEGNILIQTDEQQILINTDADNQVLLPMNSDNLGVLENSEGDGNPIFAPQPAKNQDILAAALADTDVFQPDQSVSPTQNKIPQSQLSPNGSLYPSGVSNVLGTTLSLSSPIMTPLEVPSSNNKKIPDEESDILTTEVAKNVDLPITITDPNISQTVAQQQVASLIASELTGNLELPLAIPDQVPLTSAGMDSPSYVYSLPSLDESVDIHQKAFSGPISMPLLTEDPASDPTETSSSSNVDANSEETTKETTDDKEKTSVEAIPTDALQMSSPSLEDASTLFESTDLSSKDGIKLETPTFLSTTLESVEGLCTLGGAICSSLSEPPPDMFDLTVVNRNFLSKPRTKKDSESLGDIAEDLKPECNIETNLGDQNLNIEEYDKFENYEGENKNDSAPSSNVPLNSESSSPAVNIDENSCEIPVQPQIVTDLSSTSFDNAETADPVGFESNKRTSTDDSLENEKKKIKFD